MSNLDGTMSYWRPSITNIVKENIASFISYGLLELGAYQNIYKDQLGINGQNMSILRPIDVPGVSGYTQYQGIRADWVWEKNISLKSSGVQPVVSSGIFVNDVFFPLGVAVSGASWYYNYPRGTVVFSSPLPSSWIVKSEYCVRMVSTYRDDGYVYKHLTSDWLQRNQNTSGVLDYSIEERAYLPAIFVGIAGYRTIRGTQQGSRGKFTAAQVVFNVLSTSAWDSNQLTDILYFSESKAIQFYNVETAPKALNSSGSIADGSRTWPYAVSGYALGNGRYAEDAVVQYNGDTLLPARHSRVGVSLEFDITPI